MSDLTREDKIDSLSGWCARHPCNSLDCRIYDICHQYPGDWSEQSNEVIDKIFEALWEGEDETYEVFSNGFSVPISKELSQKIDKVINDQKAKADSGKAQISLVPMEIIWAIAWILEPERYRDALMRHLLAYISDPKSVDEESGYPHLWHAACNMAFLMHFDYGEEVLHDPNKTV